MRRQAFSPSISLPLSSTTLSPAPTKRHRPSLRACTPSPPHRILLLGGTGRVGAATAASLAKSSPAPLHITLAGRSAARGSRIRDALNANSSNVTFSSVVVDTSDEDALLAAMASCDTVLHTAGPFQRRERPAEVLKAALRAGKNYVDVCDDVSHARAAKALSCEAEKKGLECWIATGIYPGVSNLLAVACVNDVGEAPTSVKFSYYTAGTGGIVLLSEEVTVFVGPKGVRTTRPPASDVEVVDFGGDVGEKSVYLLNLPEVESISKYLCFGEVTAKFATGPPFWNSLLRATARYVPSSLLRNQKLMLAFSKISLPVVRAVDVFSGARTAIRVDVEFREGKRACGIYEHETLQGCVGDATAAFVSEMIFPTSSVPRKAGVYFPEEIALNDSEAGTAILRRAAAGADRYAITVD